MSKDDEDPMAYLNKVRAQMDTLKLNQEAGDEALIAASNAKDSMERIESMLTSREDEGERKARNQPPPGLSAEEEQEWWAARIAFLSKPVSENYEDVSSSADAKATGGVGGGAKRGSKDAVESKASSKGSRK
mmetsp:Transcript_13976/g.23145  ORF Transcript_13976/g.23145 Transcript_13976/m.23145 type:complete len:132 (-) Transcript_13976:265-660(-)